MKPRIRSWHPTIRLRLTLNYAGLFVIAAAALLALNFGLLYNSLYGPLSHIPLPDKSKFQSLDIGPGASKESVGALVATYRDQLRANTLLHTAMTSGIALAGMALVSLVIAWVLAGRLLRPLKTLTSAARRISRDRLHERIDLAGPNDELKELADTFDAMVARLEASFASQSRFIADASHELRTPLAIARTSVEVTLAKARPTTEQWQAMAHRVLSATGRADRLLDGLLALARSDRDVILRESHDLARAAVVALADVDPDIEATNLDVRTELRPAPVLGDSVLLDRLVANLVTNAVRHNRPDGWLWVVSGTRDEQAFVRVSNSGPVVPADEVDRLFEPFQRFGAGRTNSNRGSGLGLAIVRSIVRAHGGTISATPEPGGGLSVTVTLPIGARVSVAAEPENRNVKRATEHAES
jgi:signal transduction histidine kinase